MRGTGSEQGDVQAFVRSFVWGMAIVRRYGVITRNAAPVTPTLTLLYTTATTRMMMDSKHTHVRRTAPHRTRQGQGVRHRRSLGRTRCALHLPATAVFLGGREYSIQFQSCGRPQPRILTRQASALLATLGHRSSS